MRDRLTKSDWLRRGLLTLAAEGPGALKVGPMASRLNVSRGSFYWHFRDIGDFRAQLLRHWQDRSTDQVIRDLQSRPGEPGRLKELMRRALAVKGRLDRAIRSWAAEDAEVAAAVEAVDDRRIANIAKLLVATGVDGSRALQRATFMYWAYVGQGMMIESRHAAIPTSAVDEITALFETLGGA